jgi:hypothetical protein
MDCFITITVVCPLALKRTKRPKIRIVSNEKTKIGSINSADNQGVLYLTFNYSLTSTYQLISEQSEQQ